MHFLKLWIGGSLLFGCICAALNHTTENLFVIGTLGGLFMFFWPSIVISAILTAGALVSKRR